MHDKISSKKNWCCKSYLISRFSIVLKGIAGVDKITLLTSFLVVEVGNSILDENILDESEFNLASVICEGKYYETFGSWIHPLIGINRLTYTIS